MINFPEFLPDQPALDNPGTTVAKNVIPAARGYRSVKDLSAYSGAGDARLRGMIAVKDTGENTNVYAGNASKLYRLSGSTSTALSDVSKGGGYSTGADERWRFIEFGTKVIATNFSDTMQVATIGSGSFADLTTSPPKARYLAVVRDQVWTGYTNESGTTYPSRVRWSGIGSETTWGSSATSGSDFQDIYDLGIVTGLVGGEYATILCEHGIARAQFVGPPLFYQIDKVETARGCAYPGTVANVGRMVFYAADDGFYLFDGNSSKPIGAERVNKFWLDRLNKDEAHRITTAVDPERQLIVVSYPTTGEQPNELLFYNYSLDRWSFAEVTTDMVGSFATAGYTLEQLDNVNGSIDALPDSLDSAAYRGGQFLFGGSIDNKLAVFGGATLAAQLETSEFQVAPGRRAMLREVVPYTEGSTSVTAQIGTRSRQQDVVSYTAASSLNAEGHIPVRSEGRFHRVRINISGDWTQAQGIDVKASATGLR